MNSINLVRKIIVLLALISVPTLSWGQAVARLSEIETQPRDCLGIIGGTAVVDICGVCNGGGRDRDVCGVCFGNNRDLDVCGQCFRNGADQDACGICFGPGTGVCPGCPFGDRSCLLPPCPSDPGVFLADRCVANPNVNPQAANRVDFVFFSGQEVGATNVQAFGILFRGRLLGFNLTRNAVASRQAILDFGRDNTTACFLCTDVRAFGCFPPGEKVRLANGSYELVENVRVGDILWNPVTKTGQRVEQVVEGSEEAPLIELGFEGTTLRVTQEHPILTKDGIKQARNLVAGKDVLVTTDGSEQPLTIHRELPVSDGQYVINFKVQVDSDNPDDHMLAAGGLIAGDLILQNALRTK